MELGCGDRPTPGYLHQDITPLVNLDFCCEPWKIDLTENSLSEVIALGVMEHLRFADFRMTVRHIYKLLKSGGVFYFDVPDLFVWSGYLYDVLKKRPVPFSKEHILSTMYGWQRWPGDEHKSGWTREDIMAELKDYFNISLVRSNFILKMKSQGIIRNRFFRSEDAHIYVTATAFKK